jgi:murein DD-endopeptidase MepM/ murein hydrolase activator NlpD
MKLKFPIAIPPARVGQPFGANPPDYARFGLAGHDGQDFPTPIGTPVLAAHDGFISASNSSNSAYGLYLAVAWEEDGVIYENIYGHFSQLNYPDFPDNVFNKQYPVKAGDVIGLSGNTGNSTGPHLHFGLRMYDLQGQLLNRDNGFLGCVDPMPYLKKENMPQISTQAKGAERRIVLQAATPEEWTALCAVFGKDVNSVDETVQ